MKLLTPTLVIIGMLTLGIFGFLSMDHNYSHDMTSGDCAAASAPGVICPEVTNPLSYFSFHLNVFQGFLTAVFSPSAATLLWMFFALSLSLVFWDAGGIKLLSPHRPYLLETSVDLSNPRSQQQLTRWLSLHENSPSFMSGR